MNNKMQLRAYKVASVASVMGLFALTAVKATDPDLATVATSATGYVSSILTFTVAILGAFIVASFVPAGLKKLWHKAMQLIGRV
ncbi:MAG: hypothetical protein RLZZ324_337 [Candidatus Parcubacteria bacterium]|jgi:hypothetical protein